jgi:hypothetical protein
MLVIEKFPLGWKPVIIGLKNTNINTKYRISLFLTVSSVLDLVLDFGLTPIMIHTACIARRTPYGGLCMFFTSYKSAFDMVFRAFTAASKVGVTCDKHKFWL